MRLPAAVLVIGIAASGCARRDLPYRFRAPLVDGVAAADVPERGAPDARDRRRRPRPHVRPRAKPELALATVAELPPPPSEPEISPAVAKLYAFVGERSEQTDARFAVRAIDALGIPVEPDVLAAPDGPALVEVARAREAFDPDGPPLLGDLIVFDNIRDGEPASLIGVVVSTRDDATIEFIYLARGVIRRGWANPDRPSEQRNRDGVILNTFLRGTNAALPRGRQYLAGEFFAGFIRLDRLTQRVTMVLRD